MRMTFAAPLAALAVVAAASAAQAATTTIRSTFDTGADGWSFGSYLGFSGIGVTWDPAKQNIAMINHGYGDFGFMAPTAYLGDKSDYLGGTFTFELSASAVSESYAKRPALVLIGKNQVFFARSVGAPMTTPRPFEVSLNAANFYKGSPTGAQSNVSSAEFATMLADLRGIQIWADWTPSTETDRLDNVSMAARGVPEPTTWALIILGFGAAGASLRRRRAAVA